MYDLHLSPEQIEFRDTVRGFVDDKVKPLSLNAHRLDAGDRSLSPELLRKGSRIGLRTLALPEQLGGVGADTLTSCIVTEELAAGDADIAAVLSETSALGRALFSAMTPAQRECFLPAFLDDDDHHLALACREPGDDSALGINYHRPAPALRLSTSATRDSQHWVINGAKGATANVAIATLIAVEAHADHGPALFLVPRDAAGLTITPQNDPRGNHGVCGTLKLEAVRVPAEHVLAPVAAADREVLPLALALGIGRAAMDAALDYAGLRIQGGRRLIEHQAIGAKLADCAIRLEVARAALWRAAWATDHPDAVADRSLPDLPLGTVARVFVTEAVHRVAKDAAECFGAMGVMRDLPLQKYIHDALVCLHAGDGNADARLRIAEALAGHRRNARMLAAE